ncbi:MAG: indole-3-glycerol phosphate synthase TrpC [Planctomycetes bacterium]|nr:indole-3-glycerol phosphate synthase TrpC [Planctomycetota bacterium]
MDFLERILEAKRREVEERRTAVPEGEMRRRAADAPPPRDFRAALRAPNGIALVAEVKRASPSKGVLAADLDAAATARVYERAGASAVSVLTDGPFFKGSLADLAAARAATSLPVLRKDFLVDRYQIEEARAHGADAVLLIARALGNGLFCELLGLARELGMEALVEVHDEADLERVAGTGYSVLGINSRDLATFETDLDTVRRLAELAPSEVLRVAESGIQTREDVLTLSLWGVDAILVGESIVAAPDPARRIAELLGRT